MGSARRMPPIPRRKTRLKSEVSSSQCLSQVLRLHPLLLRQYGQRAQGPDPLDSTPDTRQLAAHLLSIHHYHYQHGQPASTHPPGLKTRRALTLSPIPIVVDRSSSAPCLPRPAFLSAIDLRAWPPAVSQCRDVPLTSRLVLGRTPCCAALLPRAQLQQHGLPRFRLQPPRRPARPRRAEQEVRRPTHTPWTDGLPAPALDARGGSCFLVLLVIVPLLLFSLLASCRFRLPVLLPLDLRAVALAALALSRLTCCLYVCNFTAVAVVVPVELSGSRSRRRCYVLL